MGERKLIILWNDSKTWELVDDNSTPHETAWNSENYHKSTYSFLEIPNFLGVYKQTPEDDLLESIFKD